MLLCSRGSNNCRSSSIYFRPIGLGKLESALVFNSLQFSNTFPFAGEAEGFKYGGTDTQASPAFKGLCVSAKYFEDLVKDGWEDVDQLLGLDRAWIDHILALAPNGGQRRNFERLMARLDIREDRGTII